MVTAVGIRDVGRLLRVEASRRRQTMSFHFREAGTNISSYPTGI